MDSNSLLACLGPRIFNRPLLISPQLMTVLEGVMRMQQSGALTARKAEIETLTFKEMRQTPIVQNGNAIIRVYDYLSYRFDFWAYLFAGNTAYEDIRVQFQKALADPSVKSVIFDINSPGGEAAGLFDLADEIYQARGTKPVYAVFNENGFSAAYAIASAADKRYISRTGSAGSVGVVAMHVDQSGWDEKIGLKYTPIFAGARKVDFSPHAPLSSEAQSLAQEDGNATYDIFVNTVARNLGMSADAVQATEAGIFQGKKAVDAGFADYVMSWNQFMGKLNNRKYGGIMKAELEKLFNEMRDKLAALVGTDQTIARQDVITKADAEELIAAAEEAAKKEGHASGVTEGRKAGCDESLARARGILEACNLAGMDGKFALTLISDESTTVEAAGPKILEAKAEASKNSQISSTVSATTTGAVNPLLADAQRRANDAPNKK